MEFRFFGGNPFEEMDLLTLEIEIILGDTTLQKQTIQQPYMMAQAQCNNLVKQIAEDERPMKIIMRGTKPVVKPNGDCELKPSSLEFENNAYIRSFREKEN